MEIQRTLSPDVAWDEVPKGRLELYLSCLLCDEDEFICRDHQGNLWHFRLSECRQSWTAYRVPGQPLVKWSKAMVLQYLDSPDDFSVDDIQSGLEAALSGVKVQYVQRDSDTKFQQYFSQEIEAIIQHVIDDCTGSVPL